MEGTAAEDKGAKDARSEAANGGTEDSSQWMREDKVVENICSFLILRRVWRLSLCCKPLRAYVMDRFEPEGLTFDSLLLSSLRLGSRKSQGFTALMVTGNSDLSTWLKRILPKIRSLSYYKSYALDEQWRLSQIGTDIDAPLSALPGPSAPGPTTRDAHLSLMDLAVMLLAARQNLVHLDLHANADPGAPLKHWAGIPPLRNCEWYAICPSTLLAPANASKNKTRNPNPNPNLNPNPTSGGDTSSGSALVRKEERPRTFVPCCAAPLSLQSSFFNFEAPDDADDHVLCCQHLERCLYWLGNAIRKTDPRPYSLDKLAKGRYALVSDRAALEFSALKTLRLHPPLFEPNSMSCWSLILLLRAVKFSSFPQLERLELGGDFVLFRADRIEAGLESGSGAGSGAGGSASTSVAGSNTPFATHATASQTVFSPKHLAKILDAELYETENVNILDVKFEDSALWARDVINLLLFGDIPVRERPNFSERRFCHSGSRGLYKQQQRYWRSIFGGTFWTPQSFPKLRELTIAGHWTPWERRAMENCFMGCGVETLELNRAVRDMAEISELLPQMQKVLTSFTRLRRVVLQSVYGTGTLATFQRLVSVIVGRPVIVQTRELILSDKHDIAMEVWVYNRWAVFQRRRKLSDTSLRHLASLDKCSDPQLAGASLSPLSYNRGPEAEPVTSPSPGSNDLSTGLSAASVLTQAREKEKERGETTESDDDRFFAPNCKRKLTLRLAGASTFENDYNRAENLVQKIAASKYRQMKSSELDAPSSPPQPQVSNPQLSIPETSFSESSESAASMKYMIEIGETRGTIDEFGSLLRKYDVAPNRQDALFRMSDIDELAIDIGTYDSSPDSPSLSPEVFDRQTSTVMRFRFPDTLDLLRGGARHIELQYSIPEQPQLRPEAASGSHVTAEGKAEADEGVPGPKRFGRKSGGVKDGEKMALLKQLSGVTEEDDDDDEDAEGAANKTMDGVDESPTRLSSGEERAGDRRRGSFRSSDSSVSDDSSDSGQSEESEGSDGSYDSRGSVESDVSDKKAANIIAEETARGSALRLKAGPEIMRTMAVPSRPFQGVSPSIPAEYAERLRRRVSLNGVRSGSQITSDEAYTWPDSPPEPVATTLSKVSVKLRYPMDDLADRNKREFGPHKEAFRRIQMIRKWFKFNPSFSGPAVKKSLQLNIAPFKLSR